MQTGTRKAPACAHYMVPEYWDMPRVRPAPPAALFLPLDGTSTRPPVPATLLRRAGVHSCRPAGPGGRIAFFARTGRRARRVAEHRYRSRSISSSPRATSRASPRSGTRVAAVPERVPRRQGPRAARGRRPEGKVIANARLPALSRGRISLRAVPRGRAGPRPVPVPPLVPAGVAGGGAASRCSTTATLVAIRPCVRPSPSTCVWPAGFDASPSR